VASPSVSIRHLAQDPQLVDRNLCLGLAFEEKDAAPRSATPVAAPIGAARNYILEPSRSSRRTCPLGAP